ncbi:MAG: hypothetical protein JWN02_114 [Acidobacteria bacterium]|nr:hypothetical protein [Acidobacteriota bacterium]
MNNYLFDAEIALSPRMSAEVNPLLDTTLWQSAQELLRERTYSTAAGPIRVRPQWVMPPPDEPMMNMALRVVDERGRLDPRDVPAFVELFFHDVFLLFNIAVPGSFSGLITAVGGEYRVDELAFDAAPFEYAWVHALRSGSPELEALPLADVLHWYERLGLGIRQLAATPMQKVLFHLLHIGRATPSDMLPMIRLGHCLEALSIPRQGLERFFEIRNAIADGTAPVLHPLHDDALDDRLEDASLDWSEPADVVMATILSAIQADVRRGRSTPPKR